MTSGCGPPGISAPPRDRPCLKTGRMSRRSSETSLKNNWPRQPQHTLQPDKLLTPTTRRRGSLVFPIPIRAAGSPESERLIVQAFENQQDEGAAAIGERLTAHPQIHHGRAAFGKQLHLCLLSHDTSSPGSGPNALAHHAIAAGRGAAASPFRFRRMDAAQYLPTVPLLYESPAFPDQPRCRLVAIQDAQVCIHHENRGRDGIEQYTMKTVIQKLNIKSVHSMAQFIKPALIMQQKKTGPKPRLGRVNYIFYLAAGPAAVFSSRSRTRVAPLPRRLRR